MMNYKETLFFVGKCLTITHEEQNRNIVEQEIKSGFVDWDKVVKLSTNHYVFPALYCNLKRANFLQYLPKDLVEYMAHITDLNRERNQQIIEQAKEINELLLANKMTPIFIKGTGNILEGLYEDIAERMVGDIDFLICKENYSESVKVLLSANYNKVFDTNFDFPSFKHHPRLYKKDKIAAIEIHKELITEKYAKEFNYVFVEKDKISKGGVSFLNYKNQFSISIIAHQINDNGQYYNTIALRNTYDVFLLSKKINIINVIEKFNLLFHPINNYIAVSKKVLGGVSSVKYKTTKQSQKAVTKNNKLLENSFVRRTNQRKWTRYVFIKARLEILFKSLHKKEYCIWLVKRLAKGRQN